MWPARNPTENPGGRLRARPRVETAFWAVALANAMGPAGSIGRRFGGTLVVAPTGR